MKRIFALFLSALLLATVLCGCGDATPETETTEGFGSDTTSSSGEPAMGGELVVGISQDLGDSLDPYQMTAAGTREVLFNVYEGLVKPNADGDYVAAVASDYSVSEDGLTYTFTLRDGVLFHNGDSVTVEDVVYSYENCAATTVEEALAAALSHVQSVEASGDNAIVIKLDVPNPDFLCYVAMVHIIPNGYADCATAPIGTGPFQFVSRSVQESLVLEKFADYWGDEAYLDQVTFKIYEDANALMSALSAGSVDMAEHLTIDQVDSVAGDYTCLEGTMNLVQALYLNNAVEPFNNELVRQAMCYAINVDEILDITAEGHGAKLGSSIYPAFAKYFDEALADAYPYDVEKAKELLAEAGYEKGFSMKITVPSNYTPHMNVAEVLVEQLRDVGIRAKLNPVEWDTWLSDTYIGRNFESTVIGFDAATLSAGALLDRWMSDNETNMINYNNPDYDKLMAEANACTDDAQQTELYRKAAKLLSDTAANVYIQDMAEFLLLRSDVEGYVFYPLYVMDLSTLHYVEGAV